MKKINANKMWLWGYTLEQIPGSMPFVEGSTYCSLETGAKYLGCDNVFWMNSIHTLKEPSEKNSRLLKDFKQICCGLTHLETRGPGRGGWELHYVESARKAGRLSKKIPSITGVMLDDFHVMGPSQDITPKQLAEINDALKSENPGLELNLVMYRRQTADEYAPYADSFDGISFWDDTSNPYYWNTLYRDQIAEFRQRFPEKKIIQGQFMHDFWHDNKPMPMEILELQCDIIAEQLERGNIDGWAVIQNGFFCRTSHRRQTEYLRNFWAWYNGCHTTR